MEKMELTKERLEELAEMAMIALPEETAGRYAEEMKDLYALAELLPPVSDNAGDWEENPMKIAGWAREDQVGQPLYAEEILSLAPEICGNCIAVPRVVEEKK